MIHITGTGIILTKNPVLYLINDQIYNYAKNLNLNDDHFIIKIIIKKI